MMKNICCSFDNEQGVVYITYNNGVHPDREGHHSGTVCMTRENFNKCCENRELFNKPLGVDVTLGWQTALKNAISNAKNLKPITPDVAAKRIITGNIAKHGKDVVAADMNKLAEYDEQVNKELEEFLKKEREAQDGKNDADGTETSTAKGRKKSRGTDSDKSSDEGIEKVSI